MGEFLYPWRKAPATEVFLVLNADGSADNAGGTKATHGSFYTTLAGARRAAGNRRVARAALTWEVLDEVRPT